MTARQGNEPDTGQKRSGDIQARQTDDGSFELVMDDAGASASADSTDTAARPGADTPSSRAKGSRRLVVGVVVAFATVGAVAYALSSSGSDEPLDAAAETSAEVEAGFRPYLGGPGDEAASAAPSPVRADDEEEHDEIAQEDFEQLAPADNQAEADEPSEEAEEEWMVDGDSEVVVIEEEHPPEDEFVEEADVEEEPQTPKLKRPRIEGLRKRIKLPVQTPKLKHMPRPELNRLQPQVGSQQAGGEEHYDDGQPPLEEEGEYVDEPVYEDQMPDEESDSEYQGEEGSFDDYEEDY